MHRALAWLTGLLAVSIPVAVGSLAGCKPDLAECGGSATPAEQVVYLSNGDPMYAGQALVVLSCASGRCHDSTVSETLRNGAPASLDFNMELACGKDDDCDERDEQTAELMRIAHKVTSFDREILQTLQDGSMPPSGDAPEDLAYRTFELGTFSDPLPAITTREGREIVSQWLGCGAPIVEVARRPNGDTTLPGERCDDEVGGRACRFAAIIPPPDPQWGGATGIYQRLVVNLGCLSCHRPGRDSFDPDEQVLDLCQAGAGVMMPEVEDCDPTAVLASLSGQAAVGYAAGCTDPGTLITPNDPDASFFYQKLTSTAGSCGDPMPSGTDGISDDEFLAPIRQWIMDGAMP